MVPKLNTLNASRLLFMMLLSAVFLCPLVNAEEKKFKLSNDIKSAKAVIGKDKKLDGKVKFDPADYKSTRVFDLIVGGCKIAVQAREDSGAIVFNFYSKEGVRLGSSDNPKSFSINEKSLIFDNAKDKSTIECDQKINFVLMEGSQGNFTLELKLDGDIKSFELSAENLLYDESKAKANVWLFVGIGVGVVSLILIIIAGLVIGICIYIKCRKQKSATAKSMEPNEVIKTAVSAEETKMPKKFSKERNSSKEKHSAKDSKATKAKKDQKPDVQSSAVLGAKPSTEVQPKLDPGPSAQELKAARKKEFNDRTVLETLPTEEAFPKATVQLPQNEPSIEPLEPGMVFLHLKNGESIPVELEPKRTNRKLMAEETMAIERAKEALEPDSNLPDEKKLFLIKDRDDLLEQFDELHRKAQEKKKAEKRRTRENGKKEGSG